MAEIGAILMLGNSPAMKQYLSSILLVLMLVLASCGGSSRDRKTEDPAQLVREDLTRSWKAYVDYAWGMLSYYSGNPAYYQVAGFFFAETLKYLYLAFSDQEEYCFENLVFSTEAHPYIKSELDPDILRLRLKIQNGYE